MIRNKNDYMMHLKEDLTSHKVPVWKCRYRYSVPIVHFQRMLRKLEYYKNCKKSALNRLYLKYLMIRFRKLSIHLGFTIPPNVFGPGLNIVHYGSVVVNGDAKIGRNCRIHSATNIGGSDGKAPTIGDNVYIAPGAKIFGNITIGNNVEIGANAVVNRNVPDNCTVVGIPAKIVKMNGNRVDIAL
jgi:serine O-acetyltransferase